MIHICGQLGLKEHAQLNDQLEIQNFIKWNVIYETIIIRSVRHYVKARHFRRWDLKSAKLKCHQKYFFSVTTKLKRHKIKFLDQNANLKWHKIKIFIFWMKEKTKLATSNSPKGESYEKNCSETRKSMVKTATFQRKLYITIFKRANSSHSTQVFLNEIFMWNYPKSWS